jgi:hypothetical protein
MKRSLKMPVNTIAPQTPITIRKNTSFGCENCGCSQQPVILVAPRKDSFIKRTAVNFVAGAAVGALFEGIGTLLEKGAKLSGRAIAKNAAVCGVLMIVIDTAFSLAGKLFGSNNR